MGISRSSLFNKIRGLADVTPNEMIQLVKLKKGAKLLKEGNYRISEISYMVGFSSPSYLPSASRSSLASSRWIS